MDMINESNEDEALQSEKKVGEQSGRFDGGF